MFPGGSRARDRVPDQRLYLSSLGTARNRKPSQLTLALAGSVVAVTAFASGATGAALAGQAAASTATRVDPASVISPASLFSPAGAARDSIVLLAAARAPRQIARAMLPSFRWSAGKQFKYLNWLWERESAWNKYASNPYSGAYGIPQALPGSKMASAGPNWRSNAATQIRWGLRYIKARYASPRRAWDHSQATGWY
jgi:hypothetical protein